MRVLRELSPHLPILLCIGGICRGKELLTIGGRWSSRPGINRRPEAAVFGLCSNAWVTGGPPLGGSERLGPFTSIIPKLGADLTAVSAKDRLVIDRAPQMAPLRRPATEAGSMDIWPYR